MSNIAQEWWETRRFTGSIVLPASVDMSVQAKDAMQQYVPAASTLVLCNVIQLMT